MKNKRNILLFSILIFLNSAGKLHSAFQEIGVGARAIGMGGAFVAVADDNHALLWNPAGLSQLSERQFSATSVVIPGLEKATSGGIGYNFFSVTQPLGVLGTIGVGWLNLGMSVLGSSPLYSENTYILSFGRNFGGAGHYAYSKYFESKSIFDTLSLGVNIKVMQKAYNSDVNSNASYLEGDSVFNLGTSTSALSIDAGLFIEAIKDVPIGIFIKNITQPDISLESPDLVPMEIKVGAAYKGQENAIYALEGSYLNRASVPSFLENIKLRVGGEYTNKSKRVSYTKLLSSSGDVVVKEDVSYRGGLQVLPDFGLTVGFGYRYSETNFAFQIDYSFQFIMGREFWGPFGKHRISVTFIR